MRPFIPRLGLALAALSAVALVSGCGPSQAELQAEATRIAAVEAAAIAARQPPPIALNDSVAQAAAVYVAFTRDMTTIHGGFSSPQAVQDALRRGAAYDPDQISRGIVAYATILALQSPEFVSGVRQAGATPEARRRIIERVVAEPAYATTLPGAQAAASLIMSVLERDLDALARAADSVESDAYTIQAPSDPRSAWARAPLPDREARLQTIKDISARTVRPDMGEWLQLQAAADTGSGLGVSAGRLRNAPYPASVSNALAMAALAALGAAGDNARANTDALQYDRASQDCLASSKLNLFQCLAASRPSYEEVFCVGRHVMRDLATCARGAALPARIVTVGDPSEVRAPTRSPDIDSGSLAPDTPPAPPIQPVPLVRTPAVQPAEMTPRPDLSPTQRLNAGPNR